MVKTGSFHWAKELAEDREAADGAAAETTDGAADEAADEAADGAADEAADAAEAADETGDADAAELSETVEAPGETPAVYCVTVRKLNVRAGASVEDQIVGSLSQGDEVQVTGTVKDSAGADWYKISYQGEDAYVAAAYVAAK